MICIILLISVFLCNSNRCHLCFPSKFWFVISDRSVLRFGKNLFVKSVVFSIWVYVIRMSFSIWSNNRIVTVSGFRKFFSFVHLFIFHIVFGWMMALAISSLQYIIYVVCNTVFCRLYIAWIRFYIFCDDVLWYSLHIAFPSNIVS